MSTRKADRWKRESDKIRLEHIAAPFAQQIPLDAWEGIEFRIANALRKQHQWVKKMARDESVKCTRFAAAAAASGGDFEGWMCRKSQCDDFLAKLKDRAQ